MLLLLHFSQTSDPAKALNVGSHELCRVKSVLGTNLVELFDPLRFLYSSTGDDRCVHTHTHKRTQLTNNDS